MQVQHEVKPESLRILNIGEHFDASSNDARGGGKMTTQWYACCRASPCMKKAFLCEQLSLSGIECYYAHLRIRPVNPRSLKVVAYFPGYVFGCPSLPRILSAVRIICFDVLVKVSKSRVRLNRLLCREYLITE